MKGYKMNSDTLKMLENCNNAIDKFNKIEFAQVLKKVSKIYSNQRVFSEKSKINRTYISKYINMKLEEPPKPIILKKLADSSNGITTYEELMQICGYLIESNIKILKDNKIKKEELFNACIIIDDEIRSGVIIEVELEFKEKQEYEIKDYKEKIKVQQALFELSLTDVFSKQNVEVVKTYIDKLERNQK